MPVPPSKSWEDFFRDMALVNTSSPVKGTSSERSGSHTSYETEERTVIELPDKEQQLTSPYGVIEERGKEAEDQMLVTVEEITFDDSEDTRLYPALRAETSPAEDSVPTDLPGGNSADQMPSALNNDASAEHEELFDIKRISKVVREQCEAIIEDLEKVSYRGRPSLTQDRNGVNLVRAMGQLESFIKKEAALKAALKHRREAA